MVLPVNVAFCDAAELAAIMLQQPLFEGDLARQFFPGQVLADVEAELKDMLSLAKARQAAIRGVYPFTVTDRSIVFNPSIDFNVYTFLLLGRALNFGGPVNADRLLRRFRRLFEDVVSWSLKKAGFSAEVLSEPRRFRGLSVQLAPALRQISDRFKESAVLRPDFLLSSDNDLDVDVVAVPIVGNASRGGWPSFQIQCATGDVAQLQSKLQEGSDTFGTVWHKGFFPGSCIRAVATPDDLITLTDQDWHRLGQAGWVLDRTRIAHLSSGDRAIPLLNEVTNYWAELWAARLEIDWQNGWHPED